jgi:hypothetical protein
MTPEQLTYFVYPATRWREFPSLKRRLRGHWAVVRHVKRHAGTGMVEQEWYELSRIERPAGEEVVLGNGRRARLFDTWIVPAPVMAQEPDVCFFKDITSLRDALHPLYEAFFAGGGELQPWLEWEVEEAA